MTDKFKILTRANAERDLETFKREWSLEIAHSRHDAWGLTLLHNAVSHGRIAFVEFMLEKGVDPNVRTLKSKTVPLAFGRAGPATERRIVHLMLLKKGGNPYLHDTGGFFPAHMRPTEHMESFLMVELVCGEADNFSVDLWRVVKPFIYICIGI